MSPDSASQPFRWVPSESPRDGGPEILTGQPAAPGWSRRGGAVEEQPKARGGPLYPSRHAALFHAGPDEFAAVAVPYLVDAARSGERVVAVMTDQTRDVVATGLPDDVDVEFADAHAWYITPGQAMRRFDEYLSQREASGQPVSILAEPVWPDHDLIRRRAWHRCESLWRLSAPPDAVSLLCAHDIHRLNPGIVETARRTHPSVITPSGREPSTGYTEPRELCDELAAGELPAPGGTLSMMDFDIGDLAAVRSFVARMARLARLAVHRVDDVVTAVNEVALNAVVHGGGHGCLRCWRDPWQLIFEVQDRGEGRPDQLAAYVRPRRESLLDSGLGLWIANQCSDVLEVRDGPGWLVRLYTFLRAPVAPAAN